MVRFKILVALAGMIAASFCCGWTQTAQAQCQNGVCPLTVANGTVIVSSPAQSFVSNNGIINSSTTIGQTIYLSGSNCCGYMQSTIGPSVIDYGISWPNYYSNPSLAAPAAPSPTLEPAAAQPKSATCSGGMCKIR